MRKSGTFVKCIVCNSLYYAQTYRLNKTKYCSKKCHLSDQQKDSTVIHCQECKREIIVPPYKVQTKKYCSLICKNAAKRKRDTATEIRTHIKKMQRLWRGNNSSRNTRLIAFNYKPKKCEVCGYDEYSFCLDVHHKDGNPNNRHPGNLMVLCVICHRKLHHGIEISKEDKNAISTERRVA